MNQNYVHHVSVKNFNCGLFLEQKNTKTSILWKVPQNQDLLE